MTIRDAALPILDAWRGRLDTQFGLRRYDVALLTREWPSGSVPGSHGITPVETTVALTVGDAGRPRVDQLSAREIAASGGLYEDRDIRIGPFTPPYVGGGADPVWFAPPVSGDRREYYILISNADTGELNQKYQVLRVDRSRPLRWMMVARKIGA